MVATIRASPLPVLLALALLQAACGGKSGPPAATGPGGLAVAVSPTIPAIPQDLLWVTGFVGRLQAEGVTVRSVQHSVITALVVTESAAWIDTDSGVIEVTVLPEGVRGEDVKLALDPTGSHLQLERPGLEPRPIGGTLHPLLVGEGSLVVITSSADLFEIAKRAMHPN
jgi:hypothetical protein